MSTPEERHDLYLDAQEQTEEWNRALREEERDARVEWDPRDEANYPDAAEIARGNHEARADHDRWIRNSHAPGEAGQ